jgi:adenine/guanine phosphoribosyltransferase-like PRPP-binding protein
MRYHLNVRDGVETTFDEEGEILADLEAARRIARASVRALVADDLLGTGPIIARCIDIADDAGSTLASVSISVIEH